MSNPLDEYRSHRKLKYLIAMSLFVLTLVFALFASGGAASLFLLLAVFGLFDFLYQDLLPQWWHWGRWAGNFSDELSEEVVEAIGLIMLGVGCFGMLGTILFG